jgi:hypothetical protein
LDIAAEADLDAGHADAAYANVFTVATVVCTPCLSAAIVKTVLAASARDVIHEDRARAATGGVVAAGVIVSEFPADDVGVVRVESVIADSSPLSAKRDLDPARAALRKADGEGGGSSDGEGVAPTAIRGAENSSLAAVGAGVTRRRSDSGNGELAAVLVGGVIRRLAD